MADLEAVTLSEIRGFDLILMLRPGSARTISVFETVESHHCDVGKRWKDGMELSVREAEGVDVVKGEVGTDP